jgi:hypothetical protein
MNVNNFENNLKISKLNEIKLLRARIRKFYELVFLGLIDIEQPSYEIYQGKQREQNGVDTQITLKDKDIIIQEKIRTFKYWNNRQKDIYVELKNDYRGGDGWFEKYRNKIDAIGYYWYKENLTELHFALYNKNFFEMIENLIKNKKVFYPNAHLQVNKNGELGGKTSGCIVQQLDLKDCEIARFHFRNNQYIKL